MGCRLEAADVEWIVSAVRKANALRGAEYETFMAQRALRDAKHTPDDEHHYITALSTLCPHPWSRDADQMAVFRQARVLLQKYDPRGVIRKESPMFQRARALGTEWTDDD